MIRTIVQVVAHCHSLGVMHRCAGGPQHVQHPVTSIAETQQDLGGIISP